MKTKQPILVLATMLATVFITTLGGCTKPADNEPLTCSNGVMDGDETGVDCGGSCTACTAGMARVKTISGSTSNNYTDSITYDAQNRQIKYWGTDVATYTYTATTIVKQVTGGTTPGTTTYTLNTDGYATSATQRFTTGTVWLYRFAYDADGHQTLQVRTDSAANVLIDSTVQTWANGNLVSSYIATYNFPGYIYSNYTYTYVAGKANTIGNQNQGIAFLGKDSKEPVNTYTSNSTVYSYVYEYDASGRIASYTIPTLTPKTSFTYF